ncbi:hypothetical protein Syun_022922 [Stephania yunnanensis]|uniref:BRO1 domain-containing protein n=1 Tax=Stephania yunnanensis TaxID=152371 RepID=A0AAP0F7Z6_9MAGN
MLNFPDPVKLKTKKWLWQLIFEEIYKTPDAGTLEQLKELSARRRAFAVNISESSSNTEATARHISDGLNSRFEQDLVKLELYLPLLENLIYNIDLVRKDARMACRTSWSSAFSSSCVLNLKGAKFFTVDDLHFERAMCLTLYAGFLRQRGLEILSTDIVQSATLLRKAAGVYQYLADEMLPSVQSSFSRERPPEATSPMSSIMSLICLAEAQAVTLRKAEEKGSTHGILVKLHFGIKEMLNEATTVLQQLRKGCKNISPRLEEFICSCKALLELRSEKHLAESLEVAEQVGVAIGVVRRALNNAKRKMPTNSAWRSVFKQEMEVVSEKLQKVERENELVWYHKIPHDHELPLLEGKTIVSAIPYKPQMSVYKLVFRT